MTRRITDPRVAALVGLGLALPFVVLNAIVVTRLEPVYSMIPAVLLYTSVLLIGLGAVVTAWPTLWRGPDGRRRIYVVNALLAVVLSAVFVLLVVGLGEEIYRCDILDIPNCD